MRQIVFATGNEHKLREAREILDGAAELISMREAGFAGDVEETGLTFAENAFQKAETVCRATGMITLADDSGLVVDAMNGEPGIYSARFLGEKTPHSEKNAEILRRLAGVPKEKRTARFVCACCCVFPDGRHLLTEGIFEGEIGEAEHGENGFGYDPIFYVPEYSCTSAELSPEEKNAVSHRGIAFRKMRELLLEEPG